MKYNKLNKIFFLLGFLSVGGMLINNLAWAQETDLKWQTFEEALELAEKQGKPILVDVWAPWCGWCKKMQKKVYPELSKTLNAKFVLTRLNRDDNETEIRYHHYSITPLRLAQKFNVQNVPGIVILSSEGEYLFHISGFIKTEKLEAVFEHMPRDTPEI